MSELASAQEMKLSALGLKSECLQQQQQQQQQASNQQRQQLQSMTPQNTVLVVSQQFPTHLGLLTSTLAGDNIRTNPLGSLFGTSSGSSPAQNDYILQNAGVLQPGAGYYVIPQPAHLNTSLDCKDEGSQSDDMNKEEKEELREQDRFLPIANIARIMKKVIPDSGKIAKESKECVQECVSEFISFITSEASDRCHQEKRKTINGEDILYAMNNLGFENYVEPLKVYLQKYRETIKGDKPGGGPGDPSALDQSLAGGETMFQVQGPGDVGSAGIYQYSHNQMF